MGFTYQTYQEIIFFQTEKVNRKIENPIIDIWANFIQSSGSTIKLSREKKIVKNPTKHPTFLDNSQKTPKVYKGNIPAR